MRSRRRCHKWAGKFPPSRPSSSISSEFVMDDENQLRLSHFDMDDAFCARMRMAIAAGLETAPIGVVTATGTKKPKYFPAERLAFASQRDVDL